MTNTFCGYIALVGRPNVGKSTLLNNLVGQKLSITSMKPQTTRHSILGIDTHESHQFIYVDTPGIQQNTKKAINKWMNKAAYSSLADVDIIVFVLEALRWQEEDALVLRSIVQSGLPCIAVVNKVDSLVDKMSLLPWLETISAYHPFAAMIPISAKTGLQVDRLQARVKTLLPAGPHLFDADQLTDRSSKFLCAELMREKIFRFCGQEIPYATTVEIESFKEEANLITIHALIWVDRPNHKHIVVGHKGKKLKEIASQARLDMEKLLGKKVFLLSYCKVKSGWANDERLLKYFGLHND